MDEEEQAWEEELERQRIEEQYYDRLHEKMWIDEMELQEDKKKYPLFFLKDGTV